MVNRHLTAYLPVLDDTCCCAISCAIECKTFTVLATGSQFRNALGLPTASRRRAKNPVNFCLLSDGLITTIRPVARMNGAKLLVRRWLGPNNDGRTADCYLGDLAGRP